MSAVNVHEKPRHVYCPFTRFSNHVYYYSLGKLSLLYIITANLCFECLIVKVQLTSGAAVKTSLSCGSLMWRWLVKERRCRKLEDYRAEFCRVRHVHPACKWGVLYEKRRRLIWQKFMKFTCDLVFNFSHYFFKQNINYKIRYEIDRKSVQIMLCHV